MKTGADYELITEAGYAADGTQNYLEIREIKSIYGVYCYKFVSAKKNLYW